MKRPLTARHPVTGSHRGLRAVLAADPRQWLPGPARPRGIDRWTIQLVAGPVTRSVACQVGAVWRDGDTISRSVSWHPQPDPEDLVAVDTLLPTFRGALRLKTDGDGLVLTLRGSYTPPAGRLGAAVDVVALHRVAQHTAERFLADVAARLHNAAPHHTKSAYEIDALSGL